MALQMIHRQDRDPTGIGEGLSIRHADEQRSNESRAARHRYRREILGADLSLAERFSHDEIDGLEVTTSGKLRHDPAETAMNLLLCPDHIGPDRRVSGNDRRGRFITGCLDAEDHSRAEGWGKDRTVGR